MLYLHAFLFLLLKFSSYLFLKNLKIKKIIEFKIRTVIYDKDKADEYFVLIH
jgi:hypothetical protein